MTQAAVAPVEALTDSIVVYTEPQLDAKRAELEAVVRIAGTFAIRSESDAQSATAFIQTIKADWKELDEQRKSYTKPWREREAKINALYKPLLALLESAEAAIKKNVAEFVLAERQRQAAALKAAAAAHVQGDQAQVQSALAVANATSVAPPKGVSVREVWTAELVDSSAVPREWCTPDVQRVAAMARSTPADAQPIAIPGFVFKLVPMTTVRK